MRDDKVKSVDLFYRPGLQYLGRLCAGEALMSRWENIVNKFLLKGTLGSRTSRELLLSVFLKGSLALLSYCACEAFVAIFKGLPGKYLKKGVS